MSAGPPALPLPPSPRMGSDWDLPSALSPPPPPVEVLGGKEAICFV